MELSITWLNELREKFKSIDFNKVIDKSIKKSIFLTEAEAKKRTPVDTWLLRNSYETNFRDLEWTLRNFREYGPYVEARVWFLKRTWEYMESRIKEIFESDFKQEINKLNK
jgi:hypothetical protein